MMKTFAHGNARSMSPERNFYSGAEARRLVDIKQVYLDSKDGWQECVYEFARKVAERQRPARVIDIGVGGGQKLLTFFEGYQAEFLQVDFADGREAAPEHAPFFQANLEDASDLDALRCRLDTDEPVLMILSDVIEHIDDPRLLLRVLRAILKKNPLNRLIISTPDRDRIDGVGSRAIPDNPSHVRQWVIYEFASMLDAAGFKVEDLFRGPQNRHDEGNKTILAEVSCDEQFYVAYLQKNFFPKSADHLIVTTEHRRTGRSNDIGTYLDFLDKIYGRDRLVMFVGTNGLSTQWLDTIRREGWMHCMDLCGLGELTLSHASRIDAFAVLDAILMAVFLYDDLRVIEYQDFMGVGAHIAQAKKAGLIPPSVRIVAHAHGNHLMHDNAAGDISATRSLEIDARERISVELADQVIFPSKFSQEFYARTLGYDIKNYTCTPYPSKLQSKPFVEENFGKITKIAYYGDKSEQNGYLDFCDAMVELFTDVRHTAIAKQINTIILIGITDGDIDPRLKQFPGVAVTCQPYGPVDPRARLASAAAHSLVVLPRKLENRTHSITDVIESNCQFVAYRSGGLPEQIAGDIQPYVLCNPRPSALVDAIIKSVSMQFWERANLIRRIREATIELAERHQKEYDILMGSLKEFTPQQKVNCGDVTFIVPNYNGTMELLDDAVIGMRNSFKQPKKVIFIDDRSSDENFDVLKSAAAKLTDIPYEVIRNEQNKGLPGTRNAGLTRVDTPYVCAHDNDNIMRNSFLSIACRILDENPDIDVVTSWNRAFKDGDGWQADSTTTVKYVWRPLGADVGLGIRGNPYGDALSVYRTAVVKEVGGWDESSRALWEDWQLFAKLAALGKKILVIPRDLMLYRIRETSMLRTYPKFDGWVRIANTLHGIPHNQRLSLVRAAIEANRDDPAELERLRSENRRLNSQSFAKLLHGEEVIGSKSDRVSSEEIDSLRDALHAADIEINRLREIERSTTWRAARKLAGWISGKPRLASAIRRVGRRVLLIER